MDFSRGQQVSALVRVSFNLEIWTDAEFLGKAVIGVKADGEPIVGCRVRLPDGTVRNASKCRPSESGKTE